MVGNPLDLIVRVKEVRGHCPVYKVGDEFIIKEGFKLVSTIPLCMHSLASILPYYIALSRGIDPSTLGLASPGEYAQVQCLDPRVVPHSGTVIFEIIPRINK